MAALGEASTAKGGGRVTIVSGEACPCGCRASKYVVKSALSRPGVRANEAQRELEREVRVMRAIAGAVPPGGVPRVHAVVGRPPRIIMDFLGRDLWDAAAAAGRGGVPWRTVASWGASALERLRALHGAGYVHRDVKPENLVERPEGGVALIDFGLCRPWRLLGSGHVPRRTGCDPAGTLRFMSPWAAAGTTPSRRDDLAALVFTLAFLLLGRLPWQGVYSAACRKGGPAAGAAAVQAAKLARGGPAELCARGSRAAPLRPMADAVWAMAWADDPPWEKLAHTLCTPRPTSKGARRERK